jgi:UDP-glucuronate 4-epimerase
MRYVVTGAAGFIGSHLAEALLDAGHDVLAIDCFTDYYDVGSKEENALRLDVQRTDLAEDDLDFSGKDAVFHLAGQPGTRSFGNVFNIYLRRNLLATQRVFEAALAAQIPVVWSSSSSIYGDAAVYPTPEDVLPRPVTPYRSGFGLRAVALRYFTVYGPRQRPDMAFARMIDSLIRDEEFEVYGDGLQTRSFTYVSDVVDATIRALDAAPGVYNVGGGEEVSLRDVMAILEEVTGRRVRVRYGQEQTGDMRRSNADVSCIERELGWRPTTDPRVGLTRQWESSTARARAG